MKFNEGRTTEPRQSEPQCKKAKETWNQAPKVKISKCLKAKVRIHAANYVLRLKLISPA